MENKKIAEGLVSGTIMHLQMINAHQNEFVTKVNKDFEESPAGRVRFHALTYSRTTARYSLIQNDHPTEYLKTHGLEFFDVMKKICKQERVDIIWTGLSVPIIIEDAPEDVPHRVILVTNETSFRCQVMVYELIEGVLPEDRTLFKRPDLINYVANHPGMTQLLFLLHHKILPN